MFAFVKRLINVVAEPLWSSGFYCPVLSSVLKMRFDTRETCDIDLRLSRVTCEQHIFLELKLYSDKAT